MLALATLAGAGCSHHSSTSADAGVPRANVVFILADDLSWNLVQYMPHVLDMQQKGTTFSHYFVTDSLCCPSRSSILTGKYPHDTGVFSNSGDGGGYQQFERLGNQGETFATTVQPAGYRTGMMGKYLNGYVPKTNAPDPGWTGWDVAGEGGYGEYSYELNQDGAVHFYGTAPEDYLTDVLSGLATTFIGQSGATPFLLEVATFAPHAPYTPAPRYVGSFDVKLPRTPAFNMPNTNPPMWLATHTQLSASDVAMLDKGYNLRVESVQAIDDLIAAVEKALADAGADQRTYLIFSSDNGYHMGEHQLPAGKETAFDHDINVPLIVVGPGVPAGVTRDEIVENIDLCPTFAEIADQLPPPSADGHSLLSLFQGQTPSDWRNLALIEHHGPDLSPMDPSDPDNETTTVRPNSYEAIRTANAVYVEYQDAETEYYDLSSDPFEMNNTAASLPPAQVQKLHQTIHAIQSCQGSDACWKAQHL